jgi:hypothetical protein
MYKSLTLFVVVLFFFLLCNFVFAENAVNFNVDVNCKKEQQERAGYNHFVIEEDSILSSSQFSEHDNQIITKQCLMRLAEENNNIAYCNLISSSEIIDTCYKNIGATYYPMLGKRILFIFLIITAITLAIYFFPNKSYPYLLYVFSSLAILPAIPFFLSIINSQSITVAYFSVFCFFVFFPVITLCAAIFLRKKITSVSKEKLFLSTVLYSLVIAINIFCFFYMLLISFISFAIPT